VYLEEVDGGVRLALYVQPRSSAPGVIGVFEGRLKIRIAAPPVDDGANDALLRFLAKAAGVPRHAVVLEAGRRSRRKTVRIHGVSGQEARARLIP
jgi:uncharacterized protein (TIGR00251 family)